MEPEPVILNIETALAACRGDAVLTRAMLVQYRASLQEEWMVLVEVPMAASPNWEAVRKQAHRLRSSGGFLGAERIAAAARALEESITLSQGLANGRVRACEALAGAIGDFLNASLPEAISETEEASRPTVVNRL